MSQVRYYSQDNIACEADHAEVVSLIVDRVSTDGIAAVAFERPLHAGTVQSRAVIQGRPKLRAMTRCLKDGRVVLIVFNEGYEQEQLRKVLRSKGVDA